MTTAPATRRTAFAIPEWLAAAGELPAPAADRDTIAFRLELTDGADIPALDVRVGLDGGKLAVRAAAGPEPGLVLRLPREAALALLLGSGLERAQVVERGDVVAVGNFSLLFFVDAALQEDRSGSVARLRERTEVPGNQLVAPPTAQPEVDVDVDRIEEAAEGLPRTVRAVRHEVAAALGDRAGVVHLDEIYPGWDGLLPAVPLLVEGVLCPLAEGRPARTRRWDWARSDWWPNPARAYRPVPAAEVLVVEGIGSGARACAPYLSALVWLAAPEALRHSRAMIRDGETYRPHWSRWAAQEDAYLSTDDPAARADLIMGLDDPPTAPE